MKWIAPLCLLIAVTVAVTEVRSEETKDQSVLTEVAPEQVGTFHIHARTSAKGEAVAAYRYNLREFNSLADCEQFLSTPDDQFVTSLKGLARMQLQAYPDADATALTCEADDDSI